MIEAGSVGRRMADDDVYRVVRGLMEMYFLMRSTIEGRLVIVFMEKHGSGAFGGA